MKIVATRDPYGNNYKPDHLQDDWLPFKGRRTFASEAATTHRFGHEVRQFVALHHFQPHRQAMHRSQTGFPVMPVDQSPCACVRSASFRGTSPVQQGRRGGRVSVSHGAILACPPRGDVDSPARVPSGYRHCPCSRNLGATMRSWSALSGPLLCGPRQPMDSLQRNRLPQARPLAPLPAEQVKEKSRAGSSPLAPVFKRSPPPKTSYKSTRAWSDGADLLHAIIRRRIARLMSPDRNET